MENYFAPQMDFQSVLSVSAPGLAHVGDAVYELLVRTYLCTHGTLTAKNLHRATVERVSAPAQAASMERLLPLLSDDEQSVFRRGRNAHVAAVPKNATGGQYAMATGLETLFGYLYLTGNRERLCALFNAAVEEADHAT